MSAPSKEEIASRGKEELVEWARYAIEHAHCGPECKYEPQTREQNQAMARDIVALHAENERLRAENEIAGTAADMGRNTMAAQSDEIGRLRAENDRLMADALVRQTTEIALRADRAECLALLEKVEASRVVLHSPLGSVSREDVSAMVAKLRGQL